MSLDLLARDDLADGLVTVAGPSADCPRCGDPLDPVDLELDLLGSSPLACRRCGAVLGG